MSPLLEVYEDAKKNRSNEDLNAMNRVIDKLFWKESEEERG